MLDAGPRDPAGELQAVLLYTVCVAASTAFVYFFLTSSGTEERLALAHLIWWYPFVFLILYYAFAAVAELGSGDLDTRWTGSTFESYVFFRLYVACQIVGCGVECLTSEGTKLLQMIAHHIISLLAYGVALTDGRCHFFGCAAGLSEVSTIFLQGILFSKHPAAKASWPEWFTILNGVLLWASSSACQSSPDFRLHCALQRSAQRPVDSLTGSAATWPVLLTGATGTPRPAEQSGSPAPLTKLRRNRTPHLRRYQ